MRPIHAESFFQDGRGPELQRLHWRHKGIVLVAADYFNSTDSHTNPPRHLRFNGVQVMMMTPEEVIGGSQLRTPAEILSPAAIFDLGKDDWFQQFNQTHLERCSHYQVLFYDELLDLICESIDCSEGPYESQ